MHYSEHYSELLYSAAHRMEKKNLFVPSLTHFCIRGKSYTIGCITACMHTCLPK